MPANRERIKGYLSKLNFKKSSRLKEFAEGKTNIASGLPPSPPKTDDWSNRERDERIKFLNERGIKFNYLTEKKSINDVSVLRGNIENFIGFTQIPTGLAGPLRVNGLNAQGDYYVPLATTEGALVVSISRGCSLITKAGGARTITIMEGVSRAPVFTFENSAAAALFSVWANENFANFKETASRTTRHGTLEDLEVAIVGNIVHLILYYFTGDASGQNMVTIASEAICKYIIDKSPYKPKYHFIEGNLSGDKKSTAISFMGTRGKKVIADCEFDKKLIEDGLHTTPQMFFNYWKNSFVGGVQSGSIGCTGHYANALAAIFIACGQDAACVAEASVGITLCEVQDNGNLYLSVTLPNLIVGTVGGGTSVPTQKECLEMLGCFGDGNSAKFAEITAATVLAGELSIMGAIAAGQFTSAHQRYGRKAK